MQRVALFLVLIPTFLFQSVDLNPDLTNVWAQVRAQPDDFAVACRSLTNPQSAVYHNADERFPLASVGKVVLFIEYARRLDAGEITWGEMVSVGDLNAYDLPGTNGGAHDEWLRTYPAGTREITLWDVAAEGAIQFSSNAAADYLRDYLYPTDWSTLYDRLGVTDTDAPMPLASIALAMSNHDTGRLDFEGVLTAENLRADGMAAFERYLTDPTWRADEIDYRNGRRRGFPDWPVQGYVLQNHTMTGTVRDWVNVMTAVYGEGGPLTPGTKDAVRTALRFRRFDTITNTYIEYGSKLGFYSGGTLALVAYGQPRMGQPIVSAAFFRDIPRDVYQDMRDNDRLGDLVHWMNINSCAGLYDQINTPALAAG